MSERHVLHTFTAMALIWNDTYSVVIPLHITNLYMVSDGGGDGGGGDSGDVGDDIQLNVCVQMRCAAVDAFDRMHNEH